MDFIDVIKALGEKVSRLKDSILTEEATKNAFVMPFIAALGYDVFNPFEVIPEFVADLGIKKGEKVDYCIQKDGQPIIIVECKHWKEGLDVHNSQLHRYFHVTTTRFGILTNGIIYRFYTDLVEPNKMDDKPFWEINISDLNEASVLELKKFHKTGFDVSQILSTASELKYTREIKKLLAEELRDPSIEFVRYFARQVAPGKLTEKVMEQFNPLVKKSAAQLLNDIINDRLKSALAKEEVAQILEEEPATTTDPAKGGTEFTELEKEAFLIVKTILRPTVDAKRITHRDTTSYLNILLDDNKNKIVCRLWLNGSKHYISFFDETKKDVKTEINGLDDIYKFSEQLIATVGQIEARKAVPAAS
ncbi:MAG: type I restriction endonuclease [Janthinobacterium lividum]